MPRLGEAQQPVRLVPDNHDTRQSPAARLEVPSVAALESRRTHEPGVELLIEVGEGAGLAAEEEWSRAVARRRPLPLGWFALVGLVLAGAAIWSLSHIRQAETRVEDEHKQAAELVKGTAARDRAFERKVGEMEQRVKQFCEAASIEAMLPMVRHPDQVRPLMEQYYAQHPLRPLGFKKVTNFQGGILDNASDFWMVSVEQGDGRTRNILLEQEASGAIGVDWETVVTYQPMNWDEYARQRPAGTAMEFRVYVGEDHFFSHEFANANLWSSFRLTAPGAEETLFGYAPKGGRVEAGLLALIHQNEGNPVQAILRLGLPQGTQSRRGVVIERVMSSQWIYVDRPDSDS